MKKNFRFISYLFLFIVSIAFASKVSAAACSTRSSIIWSHKGFNCMSQDATVGEDFTYGLAHINFETNINVQSVQVLMTSDYLDEYIIWQTIMYAEDQGYEINQTNLNSLINAVNSSYYGTSVDEVRGWFLPRISWDSDGRQTISGEFTYASPVMDLLLTRIGVRGINIDYILENNPGRYAGNHDIDYFSNLKIQFDNNYQTVASVVAALKNNYYIYYGKNASNSFIYYNYNLSIGRLDAIYNGGNVLTIDHSVNGTYTGDVDTDYSTYETKSSCPLGLYMSNELITPIQINYVPTTCSDGTLIIRGLDEDGNLVPGKKFRVTGPDNYTKEFTIGEDRNPITISGLTDGEYTITEISVPDGYKLNDEIKTVTLSGDTEIVEFVNEKALIVIVPNTAGSRLFLIGIATIVIGLGIFILYKTMKKVKEDI